MSLCVRAEHVTFYESDMTLLREHRREWLQQGELGADCSPENLPQGPQEALSQITAASKGAPTVTPRVRWVLSSGSESASH